MNIQTLSRNAAASDSRARTAIADCDLHPTPNAMSDLNPFLARRWQEHFAQFGARRRQAPLSGPIYPKGQPDAARLDAWPPGGRPGSSLAFMQAQHLDPNNVVLGVLNVIAPHPGSYQDPDMAAAFCRAVNEWQVAEWTSKDARLKGSILVPYEQAAAAAAEIEHWAGNPNFVQVLLLSRTSRPLGNRDYWPMFAAAARAGLPVGVHAFGNSGHAFTSSGWPSYYIEEMVGHAQTCQSQVVSLAMSGAFEAIPALRIVLVESGFGWLAPLAWRLDKAWARLRAETPHVTRPPSEYVRERIWVTTQPMEEPETPGHLADMIGWIGWDRVLYASDYPHWDFDDPSRCLPIPVGEAERRMLFSGNALALYGAR